jgi:hypothetical protein
MIQFFRKIRHQLLDEGKIGKYLKYAIGEILLVVIGILIALQINNYNIYKKDRLKEAEYLTALLEDLSKDVDQLQYSLSTNDEILDGLNNVLSMLSNPKEDRDSQRKLFLNKIKYTYWYAVMEFNDVTLTQLQSTGDFGLVTSNVVSTAITNYIKGVEDCNYMKEEVQKNFHVMETSQKKLFNLSLSKRAYEFIEEDLKNMLAPVEKFDLLTEKGAYYLEFDKVRISQFYNDLLFYRSAINMYNALLENQKHMAESLHDLIENEYNLWLLIVPFSHGQGLTNLKIICHSIVLIKSKHKLAA